MSDLVVNREDQFSHNEAHLRMTYFQDSWKVDAFSAHKMENGDIYARGTQVKSLLQQKK